MQFIQKSFIVAVLSSCFAGCGAWQTDQTSLSSFNPIGEVSAFQLDRSSARTSSMVSHGKAEFSVLAAETDEHGEAYLVELDYDGGVSILFAQKTFQDRKTIKVPKQYFTQEFWDNLLVTGAFESHRFKVRYINTEDVRMEDGRFYPDTHHIQIMGIDDEKSPVKDLVLDAWVKPELPVLGAVRVDMKGWIFGMELKTGFDLE